MSAMNQFAPAWQSRFARAYAETAVETGKLNMRRKTFESMSRGWPQPKHWARRW